MINRKQNKIAFILEGMDKEPKILQMINNQFFKDRLEIIVLPLSDNIYNFYKKIQNDNDLDLVELLKMKYPSIQHQLYNCSRNDFSEIYLFFDLDLQHIKHIFIDEWSYFKILQNMLDVFNNETENGKLYISYPMVEAISDVRDRDCVPYSGSCLFNVLEKYDCYKELSNNSKYTDMENLQNEKVEFCLSVYLRRMYCLLGAKEAISYESYKNQEFLPKDVFYKEKSLYETYNKIFIISGFWMFFLDYFKIKQLRRYSIIDYKRKSCSVLAELKDI